MKSKKRLWERAEAPKKKGPEPGPELTCNSENRRANDDLALALQINALTPTHPLPHPHRYWCHHFINRDYLYS